MNEETDKNVEAVKLFDKYASAYNEKFTQLDLYNDSYNLFCELVEKPNAKILEIGCGPGNITKYLLTQRPDFKIDATDLSPNMIELAKQNVLQASFHILDCRKILQLTGKYDGIVCGFVLPYLSIGECEKLVQDCAHLLMASGIFYISFIEGNSENSGYEYGSNGKDKIFVNYYQSDYLIKKLAENNLHTSQVIEKNYLKSNGITEIHKIILARKN